MRRKKLTRIQLQQASVDVSVILLPSIPLQLKRTRTSSTVPSTSHDDLWLAAAHTLNKNGLTVPHKLATYILHRAWQS